MYSHVVNFTRINKISYPTWLPYPPFRFTQIFKLNIFFFEDNFQIKIGTYKIIITRKLKLTKRRYRICVLN